VITVEDGSVSGGMGSAILELISEQGLTAEVKRIGIPDRFIDHGTMEELYRECGMDRQGIVQTAKVMIGSKALFKAI
jgi:1-deoxy-D-xylulose-5-phosphate synthase